MDKLSQSTIEKLGYYVYLLIDPLTGQPFYVGKGCGNRINQHLFGALETDTEETSKIKKIRDLQKSGLEIEHIVLRHGLTEKEAFEVEAAVIDCIGIKNLTNIVCGHHSSVRGKMALKNIKIEYEAVDAFFDEPVVLIRINRLFRFDMPASELYDATRGDWKVGSRAKIAHIACAVFGGIIREVYSIREWQFVPGKKRWKFDGEIASQEIRNKYADKNVARYWRRGSQNPIKYEGFPSLH